MLAPLWTLLQVYGSSHLILGHVPASNFLPVLSGESPNMMNYESSYE